MQTIPDSSSSPCCQSGLVCFLPIQNVEIPKQHVVVFSLCTDVTVFFLKLKCYFLQEILQQKILHWLKLLFLVTTWKQYILGFGCLFCVFVFIHLFHSNFYQLIYLYSFVFFVCACFGENLFYFGKLSSESGQTCCFDFVHSQPFIRLFHFQCSCCRGISVCSLFGRFLFDRHVFARTSERNEGHGRHNGV